MSAERKTHLIWSHEHQMWWRSDSRGYTWDIAKAGLYTREEAEEVADAFHGDGVRHESALEAAPVFEAFSVDAKRREQRIRLERHQALNRLRHLAPKEGE